MDTREPQIRPESGETAAELEAARSEFAALREAHQRLGADLANLRERHRREFSQALARESGALIREWLEIVDDLDRALAASRGAPAGSLREGLEAVVREARHLLERRGLERIDSIGHPFDPLRHEAVGVSADGKDGHVHEELRPGYLLEGAVLRPAEVIVGKGERR
jgi:molecular chaperone GrpE